MRAPCSYDYAIIRVVPRVEREEFINAGVILACPPREFLQAQIALDETRLRALHAAADVDSIRANLQAIALICAGGPQAGPIGRLSTRERFHWLVAPRSAIIQTSPVHTGRSADPALALQRLMQQMVLPLPG